ncbi:MAG: nucleoside diphosphate kinase regulator [Prolixibacteraceae bacterium]
MDNQIVITELDYVRLSQLILLTKNNKTIELRNLDFLRQEIARAKRVDSKKMSADYVTMNSEIEILDLDSNKTMTLKLVYPQEADFRSGRISILSPLGSALLGYKVSRTISFEVPKGTKQIKITRIIYQPEANGEYTT